MGLGKTGLICLISDAVDTVIEKGYAIVSGKIVQTFLKYDCLFQSFMVV